MDNLRTFAFIFLHLLLSLLKFAFSNYTYQKSSYFCFPKIG